MSLINDALKQAKKLQPQNPPARPLPAPVESTARPGGGWPMTTAVTAIVALLVAAGIFIGLSLSRRTPLVASALSVSKAPLVTPPAPPRVKPTAAPPVATNPPPNSNVVAFVPPKPPAPKLQGILFAARRPCAIVSGRTLFVGDHVGQFRVAAILKDSVTLQSKTETNVLSLSPQ